MSDTPRHYTDLGRADLAGPVRLPRAVFQQLSLIAGTVPSRDYVATYRWCVRTDDARAMCSADPLLVAAAAPLPVCYQSARSELRIVARLHGVKLARAVQSCNDIVTCLKSHLCTVACADICYVFDVVARTVEGPRGSGITADLAPSVNAAVSFPPKLLGADEIARIVSGFCSATSADTLREEACVVCARLTAVHALTTISLNDVDLSPLERLGEKVTRVERSNVTEPVLEIPGPVLYETAIKTVDGVRRAAFCTACLNGLRGRRLPRHALANGRWLGNCPAVLQNLTYVEQLMIARFRHSFCVAQVTLGQRYLSANVIVFGQPVARAYKELPPPRSEMQDILAILVVGAAQPTDEDFSRTPFLVRHRPFCRSLEWLQVNSDTYEDIGFSASNLAEYT